MALVIHWLLVIPVHSVVQSCQVEGILQCSGLASARYQKYTERLHVKNNHQGNSVYQEALFIIDRLHS